MDKRCFMKIEFTMRFGGIVSNCLIIGFISDVAWSNSNLRQSGENVDRRSAACICFRQFFSIRGVFYVSLCVFISPYDVEGSIRTLNLFCLYRLCIWYRYSYFSFFLQYHWTRYMCLYMGFLYVYQQYRSLLGWRIDSNAIIATLQINFDKLHQYTMLFYWYKNRWRH